MARYIKLTRSEIKEVNHYHIRGFRIRVEASDAVGMPNEVFVYARHPPNPHTGEVVDEFLTVASFPDLAEYPANDPDPTKAFPFLRKSFIELDVRSMKDVENIWRLVVELVCFLRAALNRADQLVVAETVDCGQPPESESSASV